MENGSVPSVLSYALNQIQSVSVQSFQIQSSTGAGSVNPNGSIRFNLPQTGLMDFHTSKCYFSVTVTGDGARLPAYIDNLFSGIRVTAGGMTLIQNNNLHGVISTLEYESGQYECDPLTGHKDVLDKTDAVGKSIAADDEPETYGTGAGKYSRLFAVNLGALKTMCPRLVDLSLLPSIQVELIVAPASVIPAVMKTIQRGQASSIVVANGSTPSFTIDRPVLNANCYAMLSSAYSNGVRQRIADNGSITMKYKQDLAFSQNWNGSNRFSVASNSIDKITAIWRLKGYQVGGLGLVPVNGRCAGLALADGGTNGTTGGGELAVTGQRHYQAPCNVFQIPLAAPAPDSTPASTTSRAAGLIASGEFMSYGANQAASLDFNFSINSARYPQYDMGVGECLNMSLHANNVKKLPNCESLGEFMGNKFHCAIPLCLPENPYDKPTVSGLSTLGSNSFFEIKSVGTGNDSTNFESIVFVQTSTLLRVGAGRQIEVVL